MKGHRNKWQVRAQKEREALALWGVKMVVIVTGVAVALVLLEVLR